MNVLLLTPRFLFPVVGGDKNRMVDIVRFLARRHAITWLSFEERAAMTARMRDDERALFARIITVPHNPARARRNAMKWPAGRLPLQTLYYLDPAMTRAVNELAADGPFDAAIAHLIRMAPYLERAPAKRRIVEMTDAISLNYSRVRGWGPRALLYRLERPRLWRYELDCVRRFDASVVVSEVDRGFLLARDPALAPRLHTIPIGIHPERFLPRAEGYDADLIVFFGNMRSEQNRDAAVYFANHIFPLVRAQRPQARFEIIGQTDESRPLRIRDKSGVTLVGWTDQVRERVQRACLSVCPMRYGAGIQYKVLESLAMGVPVVTTTIGWEGLMVDPRRDVWIADDARSFADAVLMLMSSPERRAALADSGHRAVLEKHRWDTLLEPYERLLAGETP